MLVLGALSAIGPLTIDTYLPALPQLTAEMGATDSQAQLTITGLLLGLGLGQLLIGPLSDAVGRRKPLLFGLAAPRPDVGAVRPRARRSPSSPSPARCRAWPVPPSPSSRWPSSATCSAASAPPSCCPG